MEDEADGTQEIILCNSFVSLVVYVMRIGADYQRCLCEEIAERLDDRQKGQMKTWMRRWLMGNIFLVDVKVLSETSEWRLMGQENANDYVTGF